VRCYACGKTRHMSWDCPKMKKGGGAAHILEARKRGAKVEGAEDGRSLMMKKVLLKQEPETKKPVQRKKFVQDSLQNEGQSLQGNN
jgi:hypothetical protein